MNNKEWNPEVNGSKLWIHLNGRGGKILAGKELEYIEVDPIGGTLILFQSELIPHEVLNTRNKRYMVVGWYSRGLTAADVGLLGRANREGGGIARAAMLAVAMALVTFGIASIVAGGG